MVDQRRAGHLGFAIDQHGAGPAHLFQTIRVVGDGRGLLAVVRFGLRRDIHERRDDVHVRPVGNPELFPRRRSVGVKLAFDLESYGFAVISH